MIHFDKYVKRLNRKGSNATQAEINKSRMITEAKFDTSPSYYNVDIDGEMVDTIINRTANFDVKRVNFKYDYPVVKGSIVSFKEDKYLITEIDRDEVYSFANMEKCNGLFPLEYVEDVVVGRKPSGEPIIEQRKTIKEEPCIAKTTYYSTNENAQLPLPVGRLNIFMKYQKADNLKENSRFVLFNDTYSISSIQTIQVQDGVGIVEISAERRQDK